MPNGFILYRGPSMLDGAPIVAIVTGCAGNSANVKTGAVLQTWIIRSDIEPLLALKTGADASVCGNCKHRPLLGGACYVRVHQAPLSVYRAFHRGVYPVATDLATIGAGRAVRVGSYGDPAAVPVAVWRALISQSTMHTGYTHQWRRRPALRGLVMASATRHARADGARLPCGSRVTHWRRARVYAQRAPRQGTRLPANSAAPATERHQVARAALPSWRMAHLRGATSTFGGSQHEVWSFRSEGRGPCNRSLAEWTHCSWQCQSAVAVPDALRTKPWQQWNRCQCRQHHRSEAQDPNLASAGQWSPCSIAVSIQGTCNVNQSRVNHAPT